MGVPWHLGVLDVRLTSVSDLEGKLAKEARRFAVKPLSFLYRNPLQPRESEFQNLVFDQAGNVKRFAHIGLIYALGDIFEMESVNYIDSSTYTVLSQSKLIITATMIWLMEGKAQSMTQWFILLCTSSGMLEYVLVGKAKGGARLSESGTASNINLNINESKKTCQDIAR
jgi:hypothetical protein